MKSVLALVVAMATFAYAKTAEVPIDLSIGSVEGNPGDIVTVPINLDSGPLTVEDGIASFEFEIEFDHSVVDLVGVDLTGTIIGDPDGESRLFEWNVTPSPGNPDMSTLLLGASDDFEEFFVGSLPFVYLDFEIVGGLGSETALTFTRVLFNEDETLLGTAENGHILVAVVKGPPEIDMEFTGIKTISEGVEFSMNVTGSDPHSDHDVVLSFEITPVDDYSDEASFVQVGNDGVFSWTPSYETVSAGHTKTYNVVFTAEDYLGQSVSDTLTIVVENTNRPPVLDPIPNATVYAGDTFRYSARGVDPDGGTITYSDNTHLFDINASTGEIVYTPAPVHAGVNIIVITATDEEGAKTSRTFQLTVVLKGPPELSLEYTGTLTILEGVEFLMDVTGSDPHSDHGVELSFEIQPDDQFSSEAELATEGDDGLFSWTPSFLTVGAGEARPYTVTFTVVDYLGQSVSESLVLIVANNNRPPQIAEIPNQEVTYRQLLSVPVEASDPDGDDLFLRMSPRLDDAWIDGLTFNWLPNKTQVGDHKVTLTVFDREVFLRPAKEAGLPKSASTTFTVTVVDTNYAPVLSEIPDASVTVGRTFRLVARATDPDGDAITYSDDTGLFDIDPQTGEIEFVPAPAQVGEYVITITATDAGGASDSVTFVLTVAADTRPPQYVLGMPTHVNVTQTSATIVWNTNKPATSVVKYGMSSATLTDSVKIEGFRTAHSVNLTGLVAGTRYSYQVLSRDASNNVSEPYGSDFTTAQPDVVIPRVAISNRSVSTGTDEATISWNTNVFATGRVRYGTAPDNLTGQALATEPSDRQNVRLTGLTPQTQYYYTITAEQSPTNTATSPVESFTTRAVLRPPVISNVQVTSTSHESFTVQWETGRPASSILEWGTSSSYGSQQVLNSAQNAGVTRHSVTASDLQPSTEYHFRVGSRGSEQLAPAVSGPSYSMDFVTVTLAAPDVLPPVFEEGPSRIAASHEQATIYWKTNEAANYVIRWGVTPEGGAAVTFSNEIRRTQDYALSHSQILTSLAANTNYTVEVAAYDMVGNGPSTRRTTFKTAAAPDLNPPRLLGEVIIDAITDEGATVIWTTDKSATSVVDYTAPGETTPQRESDPALTRQHAVRLSGLDAETRYTVSVVSVDASNNVMSPASRSFTTRPVPDTTPPVITAFPAVEGQTLTPDGLVNVRLTLGTNERATATTRYWVDPANPAQLPATPAAMNHSIVFSNLAASTRYTYRITLTDASGNRTVDQERTFRTIDGPDLRPPVFVVTPRSENVTHNSFAVRWATDKSATAELSVRTAAGNPVATLTDATPRVANHIVVTNLEPNTQYSWILTVTDQSGNRTVTGRNLVTTQQAPDTTPPVFTQQPTAVYSADDRAVIIWRTDKPTVGEVYYAVEGSEYFDVAYDREVYRRGHAVTLAGLQPGAAYVYFVRALDAATPPNFAVAGDSAAAEFDDVQFTKLASGLYKISQPARGGTFGTSATPDVTPPDITSAPAVSNAGTDDATINWQTNETADSRLRILPADSIVGGGPGKLSRLAAMSPQEIEAILVDRGRFVSTPSFVMQHQLTVTELNPGTPYVAQIASLDPSGNGETRSNIVYFTSQTEIDLTPPVIPPTSIAAVPAQTQAAVSWTTDKLSTSYVRYGVGTEDESNWQTQSVDDVATQHTVVLTNLTAGTTYSYRVYSIDTRQNGPTVSSVRTFTTSADADVTPPVFTSGPTVLTKTDRTATIVWTTDKPTSRFVEWGTSDTYGFSSTDPTLRTEHRFTITNLALNTQYHFRVTAIDQSSNERFGSDQTVKTDALPKTEGPEAPTNLSATPGSRSVVLSWSPSVSVDTEYYTVYRDEAVVQNAVRGTQFTDASVSNDETYTYAVSGVDVVNNEGDKSATVNVTPSANQAPGPPTAVKPTGGQDASDPVTLVVSNVTRASSREDVAPTYSFVIATDPSLQTIVTSTSAIGEGTSSTSWVASGDLFDDGATYYWASRANDGVTSGPLSGVSAFRFSPTAIQLAKFAAECTPAGMVKVSWEIIGSFEAVQQVDLVRGETESTAEPIKSFGPEGLSGDIVDASVRAGQTPNYWLRVTGASGAVTAFGPASASLVLPQRWAMSAAYPNPFNPSTEVTLSVPENAEASVVIYNILGQPVHTLWSGPITPGMHRLVWDGRDSAGREVGSGVYIIRAHSEIGVNLMRRVTMIR